MSGEGEGGGWHSSPNPEKSHGAKLIIIYFSNFINLTTDHIFDYNIYLTSTQ